ncbi:MAG: hypothetical protein PHE32_04015 [Candidatus Shapirobacteria bacterium]|nr:hypothetical protein [Candidatus Shapirobacteria bacterium]
MIKVTCGDANPNGNIAFTYKGGCRGELDITEAYRCVGCGGWFHLDCILKHFELEEGHDNARNALRKIKDSIKSDKILITEDRLIEICEKGLEKTKPITNLKGE